MGVWKLSYFIEFSDKRNTYIFNKLQEQGKDVFKFDFNNVVLLKKKDKLLFSPAKKLTEEEVSSLPSKITILGGVQKPEILSILKEKKIEYVNLMKDEEFVVKNAMLTAEGVLALIISATQKSIFENKILILGSGRCGKSLMHLLLRLQLDFSVVTFNIKKIPENQYFQKEVILAKYMFPHLHEFDVIVNTAPLKVFEDEQLDYIKVGTTIIEVASVNCLNKELAISKGINYILAPALPQVYSFESAGELVLKILQNVEKKE